MKQIVLYTILPVCFLLASCASGSANAETPGEPVFSVAAKNSDDEITLRFEDNRMTIEISSPTGIGSAVFSLESGDMPEEIVAQLYVKGLEEVRLISGQVTIAASLPGSGGLNAQSQRKILGNSEQVIRSFDALWLNIQVISDSPTIPLEDGYFEIVFPKEFIQQSGGVFEIQWIDFFR